MGWSDNLCGQNADFSRLATTRLTYRTTDDSMPRVVIQESDIIFTTARTWGTYSGVWKRNPADFFRVAVHELGHALGLLHPDEAGQNVNALMNSQFSDIDQLQADDIAGVHVLYGSDGGFTHNFESPAPGALVSGVGFISGWKCEAGTITVRIDDGPPLAVATEQPRADTRPVCGDDNNGFITQINWNWDWLGAGPHTAVAYDDGVEFARNTFTIGTTGEEFLGDVTAECTIADFPAPGETGRFVWNTSTQHLELVDSEEEGAIETAYIDGRIYTQDRDLPWAQSLVTRGDKIVFVGSTQNALHYAARDSRLVDLQGQFVMPGIIDAHTHPGLIGIWADLSVLEATAGENEEPVRADRMPSKPKEATLAWLQQYVNDHPSDFVIVQGTWDVAAYLPHGPHKADLDKISSIKPILLYDNSGHSVWVNSAFLRLLGIDRNTPDISENLSHFVRDENGEPTGWIKEFALTAYLGDSLVPDADALKERLLTYLNYMSSKGITTLWDAGNFNNDAAVYQAAHDIAKEGNLPLRWEGSYHIWAPEQIETATEALLLLREKYAYGKLQFNTIKIHYDGLQDILTAGMLEPYATDPDNYGGVLFTTQRLSSFMQELDGQGIDLHLHAAGDRATRNILDAVEQARVALGRPLRIEVTISHLFSVAASDIKRFRELNVHANFTPHWFGGTVFGDAREINVGLERASRSQVVGHFAQQHANFTLSSDVVYNPRRVSPFIGIEMSITRQAINNAEAATLPPLDARISLEQALAGYTINGAAQLGLEGKIGAIRTGLLADFIVLPQNPFETDVERIHRIMPSATIVAGELRSGSLCDREARDCLEEMLR